METNTTKTPPAKKVTPLPKKKAEKKDRNTKGLAAYVHGQLSKGKSPEDTIKAAVKTGNWPAVTDTQCWWDYVIHTAEKAEKKAKAKRSEEHTSELQSLRHLV